MFAQVKTIIVHLYGTFRYVIKLYKFKTPDLVDMHLQKLDAFGGHIFAIQ